jgi:hypothetical protein
MGIFIKGLETMIKQAGLNCTLRGLGAVGFNQWRLTDQGLPTSKDYTIAQFYKYSYETNI